MNATAERLLATLKRHNPARVRAFTSDDDARDIAVPTRRKRWAAVIEAIEARSWCRVEMLDKSGAVLGYVENAEPAGAIEELSGGSGAIKEAERIVQLVISAQRQAMAFRDSEVTSLLRAQGDVVREMTIGMRALTAMYQEQVSAASEVAELRAIAANGEGRGQLAELVEAAPAIMQALPILKSMLNGKGS